MIKQDIFPGDAFSDDEGNILIWTGKHFTLAHSVERARLIKLAEEAFLRDAERLKDKSIEDVYLIGSVAPEKT